MMAASIDSNYSRKRQRLLSNGSTKPVLTPKKQHFGDPFDNEVINLDSEEEDYVFSDKFSNLSNSGCNFQDQVYGQDQDEGQDQDPMSLNIMDDHGALHRNDTYPNDHNLFLQQKNYYNNLTQSSAESTSVYPSRNTGLNMIDATMENADGDDNSNIGNMYVQEGIDGFSNQYHQAIVDSDDPAILEYEQNQNILSNYDDDTSYNNFIQSYDNNKTGSSSHVNFSNSINSIFNRFLKKSNSISSSNHNVIINPKKKKTRTKSLPQLAYTKMTYSPALDNHEVSLKIGDIKASFINHNTQNYTVKQQQQPNLSPLSRRKFSFQEQINSSSNNGYSSHSKSSVTTSSYDDRYNDNSRSNTRDDDFNMLSIKNEVYDTSLVEDEKCDDDDGYYIVKNGAPFANGRFIIKKLLGQGTFGKVVKAYDKKTNSYVAIKIIKSIKKYREASKIELRVLTMLKKHDPTNKFQCIHLRECFDYRDHICIVTDLLKVSLYDFMENNQFLPFPGSHIQAMTKQLLRSVAFLHDLQLIHTDLKPENILLKDSSYQKKPYTRPNDGESFYRKILKDPKIYTIDFGSAIFEDEYHSSIISTRHYRAPEIILGVGWSYPCDMWSVGAILIELLTGEALFKTHENEQHLAMMEKVTSQPVDKGMVRKCLNLYGTNKKQSQVNSRFDTSVVKAFSKKTGRLLFPRSGTDQKLINEVNQLKTIEEIVEEKVGFKFNLDYSPIESMKMFKIKSSSYDEYIFWFYYIDLIKQMLIFDPQKRITAREALNHKWFEYGILDDGL